MGLSDPNSEEESVSDDSLPREPIPLATIVSHFVASKQSLSATSHIYRANDIVNDARALLETIATLDARNKFLHSSAEDQLAVVKSIRAGLDTVADDVDVGFKASTRQLDEASDSIQEAIAELQTTTIEPCFRPPGTEPQSLHSFVDSQAVENLNATLRACIDQVIQAKAVFAKSTSTFDDEIAQVQNALDATNTPNPGGKVSNDNSIDSLYAPPSKPSTPASLFHTLDTHAVETANLLQGLIHHYDLCITALKHTEGGTTAAVNEARATLPTDLAADVHGALTLSTSQSEPPSMTDLERAHLLHVLDKDAAQLPDVLSEIQERSQAMESAFASLTTMASSRRARAKATQTAITALDALGNHLPSYTAAAPTLTTTWHALSTQITAHLTELTSLHSFFAGFRRAYDTLLLEVGHRLTTRARMDAIAANTRTQLQTLYDGEVERREAFRAESGVFLPRDLWRGFEDPPSLFRVERVDDGTCDIPVVPEGVLRRAGRRMGGSGGSGSG